MFYEHIILAKKGPLARVWLAAHWDKKITKAHVFETNIEKSVEGILQPKVKLALRTSGHLLLGVVRIYSRKAKYLLADCNEAFVKIKMAFRPGMVDLPEGHREANVNAITLPEVFHDFDTALPELNDIDIEAQFTINQSRADEITMREDYGSLSLSLHDDGFGDLGFEGDTPDIMRGSLDGDINDHLLEDNRNLTDNTDPIITLNEADIENPQLGDVDGFGDDFGHDLFAEPPQINLQSSKENLLNTETSDIEDNADHFDNNMPSPHTTCGDIPETLENDEQRAISEILINHKALEEGNLDQSTLIQNEDEGFALAPIDASAFKGVTKAKRKRKLIVDEIKNISGEEMKAQLANTTDIVTTLDLAPPTKRLMYWKETGGVEKLFSLPSKRISARVLFANYNRHLLSHFTHLEDFSCLGPTDILGLDQYATENESIIQNNKRGRKRKGEISLQETEIQPETHQSLSMPDTIRDQNNLTSSTQISLEVGADHESMVPVGNVSLYDNLQSPAPVFSLNDINSLDNLQSLNDLPVTPSNLHNVVDSTDDFHHGDHTPAELLHGQVTPRHESMEHLEGTQNVYSTHNAELDLDILDDAHETTLKPNNKSLEIESDWNEFDFNVLPGSQTTGVEQMENETDEQFEERVLNKRAAQLFYAIKSRMDHSNQDILFLSHMTIKNSRKQAAQKFYSLLVLKKFKAISIKQSAAYSDICIERGPLFENPKL